MVDVEVAAAERKRKRGMQRATLGGIEGGAERYQ